MIGRENRDTGASIREHTLELPKCPAEDFHDLIKVGRFLRGRYSYTEYLEDDGTTGFNEKYLIKAYKDHDILIFDAEGKEQKLNPDRVVKAALTKHALY